MPLSYAKWDSLDVDSDDEGRTEAPLPAQKTDPGMSDFLSLGKDASIAQIQEKIKNLSAETRDELMRDERGGLLRRMLELDSSKTYEAGEIFGTKTANPPTKPATKPKPTVPKPKPKPTGAAGGKPALKPTPRESAPASAPAPAPTPAPAPAPAPALAPAPAPPTTTQPPSVRASTDYSKFDAIAKDDDDEPRIVDITDERADSPADATPTRTPVAAEGPAPAPAADAAALEAVPPSLIAAHTGHPPFSFVRIPVDCEQPIDVQTAFYLGGDEDLLPTLLAPMFADQGGKLDHDAVHHLITASQDELCAATGQPPPSEGGSLATEGGEGEDAVDKTGGKTGKLPSFSQLEGQAKSGVCEAWPLASATARNGYRIVRMYIDEIGVLRKRPRNPRAEALVQASGQMGLTIHGDAYVGRTELIDGKAGFEKNVDFGVDELAHTSAWLAGARRGRESSLSELHQETQRRAQEKQRPEFAYGAERHDGFGYRWTQTDDDIEVSVEALLGGDFGGAQGKRRVRVGYGGGDILTIARDGTTAFSLKLYGRVKPGECSWHVDGEALVVTMEKADTGPWVSLAKLG